MAFAIMRASKLKTMGSVAASLQHCFRERETLNADEFMTEFNQHFEAKSSSEALGKLRELLPEKRRKDAVLAVEYVMTASPEWWEKASDQDKAEFFEESRKWLEEKYGAENVIAASVHNDELTPHLSAFVAPITKDGRLTAKEFIGNKKKMSDDQTSYAKAVEHLGLERGIEGSKATHQRVKAHYSAISKSNQNIPQIREEELKHQKVTGDTIAEKIFGATETDKGVAMRLNTKIRSEMESIVEKASISSQEQRRARDIARTALEQQKQLKALREPFDGLSAAQMQKIKEMASEMKKENELSREKRVKRRSRVRSKNLDRGR